MYLCPIPNGFRERAISQYTVRQDAPKRATSHVLTRVAKCTDADSGMYYTR
jgi:hypothetical protein